MMTTALMHISLLRHWKAIKDAAVVIVGELCCWLVGMNEQCNFAGGAQEDRWF